MPDRTDKTISIRIAIDIPVDIAVETLAKLKPIVQQLTHPATIGDDTQQIEASGVDEEEEARQAAIKEHCQKKYSRF